MASFSYDFLDTMLAGSGEEEDGAPMTASDVSVRAAVGRSTTCNRIDWHHFLPREVRGAEDFVHICNAFAEALGQSRGYCGITFDPLDRMHLSRDREGPSVSHFPCHYRSMSVICHGANQAIRLAEAHIISKYPDKLNNSQRHSGVGTRQPHLYLYCCHRAGSSCKCMHCKEGRRLAAGYTSSSDESGGDDGPLRATWLSPTSAAATKEPPTTSASSAKEPPTTSASSAKEPTATTSASSAKEPPTTSASSAKEPTTTASASSTEEPPTTTTSASQAEEPCHDVVLPSAKVSRTSSAGWPGAPTAATQQVVVLPVALPDTAEASGGGSLAPLVLTLDCPGGLDLLWRKSNGWVQARFSVTSSLDADIKVKCNSQLFKCRPSACSASKGVSQSFLVGIPRVVLPSLLKDVLFRIYGSGPDERKAVAQVSIRSICGVLVRP